MNHADPAWKAVIHFACRRANALGALRFLAAIIALTLGVAACGGTPEGPDEVRGTENLIEPIKPSDSVSRAVETSCTTESVKGLSTQLVEEIQCVEPGTLERLETSTEFKLGPSVFPFLQAPAARALRAAQAARGTTMVVNSALRTLPQQYLLYRWYKSGRCGIPLAAAPGKSNHESGLALDIDDNAGWQKAMSDREFKWFGERDAVHFDFVGAGSAELGGLSVRAFQRLWNRNHQEDRIGEDGVYGAQTEKRLAEAPTGGFAIGAECGAPERR